MNYDEQIKRLQKEIYHLEEKKKDSKKSKYNLYSIDPIIDELRQSTGDLSVITEFKLLKLNETIAEYIKEPIIKKDEVVNRVDDNIYESVNGITMSEEEVAEFFE